MSISNPDVSHGTDPNELIGPRLNDEGDFYYNVSHSRESVTSEFKPGSLKDVATLDDDNRLLTTLSTPASPENLHPTTGVLLKQPERAPHVSTLTTETKPSHKKWYITGGAALAAIAAVVAIGHKGSDDSTTTPRGPIVKIVPGGVNTPSQTAEQPKPTDIPTVQATKTPEQVGELKFPGGVINNDPNNGYADEQALGRVYRMNSDIISPVDRSNAIVHFTNLLIPRFEYPFQTEGQTLESRKQAAHVMIDKMFDGDAKEGNLASQLKTWADNNTEPLEFLPTLPFSMDQAEVGGQPSQRVIIGGKFSQGDNAKAFQMEMLYKDDGNGNKGYVIVSTKAIPVPESN